MTNLILPGFGEEQPDDMDTLRNKAKDCIKCRLHETRTRVVWGQGDIESPLMLVGQGPSVTDDRTGDVYSGPAGEELDELLHEAGLSRATIYITNIHKCVARQKDDPYNIRTPTKTELKACRDWLDGEFRLTKAKWVLCIGTPAARWVINDKFNLTEQRGQWFAAPFGAQAMATYQPTYITRLRQHDAEKAKIALDELQRDFREAAIAAGLA